MLLQESKLAAPSSAYENFLDLRRNFPPGYLSFCTGKEREMAPITSGSAEDEGEEKFFLKFARCENKNQT